MPPTPGSSPRNPLHVRTESGEIDWKRVLVMLAITALSGYLAAQSQRSGIDFNATVKMRAAKVGQHIGDALITTGIHISGAATKLYDSARA
jgi:cell division protein ZapA (FtsZ GTPase activity inhibitor)